MASLTGGFAPIPGASAAKDKSSSGGGKKNELTGGLIGIGGGSKASSSSRVNDDLDFGDFDVDDLLLEDGDSKRKEKAKPSKAAASSPPSPKKKKSSKSSSSSKKKSDKKKATELESYNEDDWEKEEEEEKKKPAKTKKSAFDMDDFIAPVKKNAQLDDEFARMLGLEDELVGQRSGGGSGEDVVEAMVESPVKKSPPAKDEVVPSPPPPVEDTATGGLSAAFFQDEGTAKTSGGDGDGGSSFLSFLSTGSERRGARGGRRNADKGEPLADPFAGKNDSAKPSGLDNLFSSSSRLPKPTPSSSSETAPPSGRSTFASLFGKKTEEGSELREEGVVKPTPRVISTGGTKPPPTSAKDDLLAELFPSDPPKKQKEIKDEAEQHDDLLAELFPVETTRPKAVEPKQLEAKPVEPKQVDLKPVEPKAEEFKSMETPKPREKEVMTVMEAPAAPLSIISSTKPADVDSARDSLLKDLLPDSPPRSRRPARVGAEVREEPTPSVVPSQSSAAESTPPPAEVLVPSPPKPVLQVTPPPLASPPQSPGKTKTLAMGTPSKVREVEFEQSKDELLEEILSSPHPSPARAPASPPSRRGSFEFEPSSSLPSRRHSRSPDKRNAPAPPPAAAPSPPPPVVVFQRDMEAEERLLREHATALADRDARLLHSTTEMQLLRDQLADAESNLSSVRHQLAESESNLSSARHQLSLLSTQLESADANQSALRRQLERADANELALTRQLADEQQSHCTTKLALTELQREADSAAQRVATQQRAQLDRLCQQLQTALAELTVVHAQGSEDAAAAKERETATRLRMLHTVEATAKGLAVQAEDECMRLASLLATLEATLRASRQENLEEKERLRQEQRRLDQLAQHFQAQSNVLHASADANAQLLGSQLAQALQDVRTADARLHARRQQLQQEIQQLHEQRCDFAVHREQWLEQRDREAAELQRDRVTVQREWHALQSDKQALDEVIAAHDDAFQALKMQRMELEREKERVAAGARHVAELAKQCDQLAAHAASQEALRRQERSEYEELRRQCMARDEGLAHERRELQQREQRLHAQLRHAEKAQRQAVDDRRQRLQQVKAVSCYTAVHPLPNPTPTVDKTPPVMPTPTFSKTPTFDKTPTFNKTPTFVQTPTFTPPPTLTPPPTFTPPPTYKAPTFVDPQPANTGMKMAPEDPASFSPAFRQLVEDNWRQQQAPTSLSDAALLRERMWINCLGLDTRPVAPAATPPSQPAATLKPATVNRPPPPPPTSHSKPPVATAAPRLLSVHL